MSRHVIKGRKLLEPGDSCRSIAHVSFENGSPPENVEFGGPIETDQTRIDQDQLMASRLSEVVVDPKLGCGPGTVEMWKSEI